MGSRFISELCFFLFCTLLCKGRAADPVLNIEPRWSTFYTGETVTLTCSVEGAERGWQYSFYKDNGQYTGSSTNNYYTFTIGSTQDNGEYHCVARHEYSGETKKSKTISLTAAERPKATLTPGTKTISVGGTVSLSCSVGNSDGWKFEFYRRRSTDWETVETNVGNPGTIQVSKGGIYCCRGVRETSGYLSHYSDEVNIQITFSNKVFITPQPSRSQIFEGEQIKLTCEVQGGGNTEWAYDWMKGFQSLQLKHEKFLQLTASQSVSGDYKCKARRRDDIYSSTRWSEAFTVSVSRPEVVLSVSPSWLIPGASVTLICHFELQSAEWSFYWFKALPKPKYQYLYTYEPLPGTSGGTVNNSFTVHGQTHTAGYACSAGRGHPVYHTQRSDVKFVWSSAVHPSASLTVNPARVQHFTSESLSLTCEGNSQWNIKYKTDDNVLINLPQTAINGSIYLNNQLPRKAVYWCESGTAFSNAVNISTQSGDVILESPVYPVTPGESVALRCELKSGSISSEVFFYKNNQLVQNGTREEMKISAVSESDEGFYKCRYDGKESPQSWMAVQFTYRSSSSFPMWIIGLICGLLLLLFLLLLLYRYRKTKDSCFNRSVSSGSPQQSQTPDHASNHPEDPSNTYASPIQDEFSNVTYSSIELKKVKNVKKKKKPEMDTIYSDVKVTSSKDDVTYAEVVPKKSKVKGKKGKTAPAATEEIVYSEVKGKTTQVC